MKTRFASISTVAAALVLASALASPALAQNGSKGKKPQQYPPPTGNPAPEIAPEAVGGLAVLLVGSFLLLQSRKRAQAR